MLTDSEKRWLRERTKFPVFSCSHCAEGRPMLEKHCVCYDVYPCTAENLVSTKDDVLEAAGFESRVAAKLAEAYGTMMDHNENHSLCQTCRLKL